MTSLLNYHYFSTAAPSSQSDCICCPFANLEMKLNVLLNYGRVNVRKKILAGLFCYQ